MKRKKPGSRRRRADDELLRKYARYEYEHARLRKAGAEGVLVSRVKNKHGHRRAVNLGLMALRKWFSGLPDAAKTVARQQMREQMASGESGHSEAVQVCDRCEQAKPVRHWDGIYDCCEQCAHELSLEMEAPVGHQDGEMDPDTERFHREAGAR